MSPLECSKSLPLETLDELDFVLGRVLSSKVKDEDREEQEEGGGEGGATLGGFFSSFIFCTGCFISPFSATFFRRKSANDAAGLLEAGGRSAGDAGEDGAGVELGAGGGGKAKECIGGCFRSFFGGELSLGRAVTKACLLHC